jgi:AGCS family alanine or glycine:cation symporter
MNTLNAFFTRANEIVWGTPVIVLLLGTGIFLTLRLGFLQITHLLSALKLAFSPSDREAKGDVSHFKALMVALAATIGTGNIAGVATAIAAGGPGALFWMWITAFFGMATKYSEAVLAVKYRITDEKGEMCGGPMYALERGLNMKWMGILFAVFGALAAFGIGNMVQANSVADAVRSSFGVPVWLTGVVLASLTGMVILGGIKRIGEIAGILVPVMAVFYMLAALVILILNYKGIPEAINLVITHAFNPMAATGGFLGASVKMAIQKGVSRGLFSNESGLGSAPIAAAAAKTQFPMQQALVSMTGTFIDTIIVCSMTGLAIISTGVWNDGKTGAPLTVDAFSTGLPGTWGGLIVSIGIIMFAYSTILGWAYYGEKCAEYLFGIRIVFPYRCVWIVAVFIGSVNKLDLVWNFSDVMNGLMAIPNLLSLVLLSGVIAEETRRHRQQLRHLKMRGKMIAPTPRR